MLRLANLLRVKLLALCVAGAGGVLARYLVDGWLGRPGGFPVGILVVNISGAFLAGLFYGVVADRPGIPDWLRLGASFGFLGAYTTFSTLSLDTVRLIQEGRLGLALLNSAGSLAAGILAVYAGLGLGHRSL